MSIKGQIKAQDQYINDLTGALRQDLDDLFAQVLVQVAAELQRRIDFGAGPTRVNRRELRKIGTLIERRMKALGAPAILDEFTAGFEGTLPYFDQILGEISAELKSPLVAKLTPKELMVLEGIKEGSRQSIEAALNVMVAQAQRNLLLRVAALSFAETVESLRKVFARGVAEVETIAATAMTMYTRTNAEQNFKRIEAEFGDEVFRYRYEGPDDKLTRPFCQRLIDRTGKRGLTRAEIDKIDNGQLPNVFVTGGGYNCRHQWILDLREQKKAQAKRRSDLTAQEARGRLQDVHDAVQVKIRDIRAELAALPPTEWIKRQQLVHQERLLQESLLNQLREVVYREDESKFQVSRTVSRSDPKHNAAVDAGIAAFRRLIGSGVIDDARADVRATSTSRSFYSLARKVVEIGPSPDADAILVHELGHWFEDVVPLVHQAAVEFLVRRTTLANGQRERKVSLRSIYGSGSGYASNELTRRDNFKEIYAGKAYEVVAPDGKVDVIATEIISMGLESMYRDPLGFARSDADFFDFIYSLIRRL